MPKEFKATDFGTERLDSGDNWFVSYNPTPSDSYAAETALVIGDAFFILCGDWRVTYANALEMGGITACMNVWIRAHKDHGSSYSSYFLW